MLRFRIDISRPLGRFERIAKAAGKLESILKRWGGYMRAKALRRADAAEGWPELAESTRKRLEGTRTSNVTVQGLVRSSYAKRLEGYLKLQERRGDATATMDLAELRRLRDGGAVDRDAKGRKAAAWGGGKAVDRLRRRLARAQDQRAKGQRARVGGDRRKIGGHKLLGSVARQILFQLQGNGVATMSRVPWSGVHNEGGTAGNGARIPERSFLRLDADDRVELSKIALEHLLGLK